MSARVLSISWIFLSFYPVKNITSLSSLSICLSLPSLPLACTYSFNCMTSRCNYEFSLMILWFSFFRGSVFPLTCDLSSSLIFFSLLKASVAFSMSFRSFSASAELSIANQKLRETNQTYWEASNIAKRQASAWASGIFFPPKRPFC